MVKILFENGKNSNFGIELHVMCTLTVVPETCWAGVNTLQHGLVLNHPLGRYSALGSLISIRTHLLIACKIQNIESSHCNNVTYVNPELGLKQFTAINMTSTCYFRADTFQVRLATFSSCGLDQIVEKKAKYSTVRYLHYSVTLLNSLVLKLLKLTDCPNKMLPAFWQQFFVTFKL